MTICRLLCLVGGVHKGLAGDLLAADLWLDQRQGQAVARDAVIDIGLDVKGLAGPDLEGQAVVRVVRQKDVVAAGKSVTVEGLAIDAAADGPRIDDNQSRSRFMPSPRECLSAQHGSTVNSSGNCVSTSPQASFN